MFTSSFAAYGFSKLNFKGRDILFLAYIGTIAVPWQSYMIPQFIMMRKVGLTDTLWSLVLLQAFNAFGVFLLKQYYSSIPILYVRARGSMAYQNGESIERSFYPLQNRRLPV